MFFYFMYYCTVPVVLLITGVHYIPVLEVHLSFLTTCVMCYKKTARLNLLTVCISVLILDLIEYDSSSDVKSGIIFLIPSRLCNRNCILPFFTRKEPHVGGKRKKTYMRSTTRRYFYVPEASLMYFTYRC